MEPSQLVLTVTRTIDGKYAIHSEVHGVFTDETITLRGRVVLTYGDLLEEVLEEVGIYNEHEIASERFLPSR